MRAGHCFKGPPSLLSLEVGRPFLTPSNDKLNLRVIIIIGVVIMTNVLALWY